jgi:hypothetical protein
MKKPLLIIAIILIILLIGFFGFKKYTKSSSPTSVVEYHQKGLDIEVTYSRPSKKNRVIFGTEQDNALVPYGKVWRTGANEATLIKIDQEIVFAGKAVQPGTYSLWTIPEQSSWKVILNKETGQWGTNYNDGQDFLKGEVPARTSTKTEELFKIYFEEKPNGADMILSWDQTEAIVPIQLP